MTIALGPMDFDMTNRLIADERLLQFNQTDAGLGETFRHLFGNELRYIKERGQWVRYVEPIWKPADELAQLRMLQTIRSIRESANAFLRGDDQERIRNRIVRWTYECESNGRLNAALNFAQHLLAETTLSFDTDPWLLATQNKVVDLRTGKPIPAGPHQCLTKQGGARYIEAGEECDEDGHPIEPYCDEHGDTIIPGTETPRWTRFLEEVFDNDQDLIRFCQKSVGYTLSGDTSEQCFFICYGLGANGKSVFLSVVEKLLGDYGLTAPTSVFMERKSGEAAPSNEIARMQGARFVKSIEVPERANFDIERMKALTGGERISARFLYQESFEFQPKAKFWMAVNHRPRVNDPTYSFWRRAYELPFNVTFPREKQDKYLLDKLFDELPGILHWAIEGCLMWQKEGLEPPNSVQKATEDYRESSDSVGLFLEECTERNLLGSVKSAKLFQAYRSWCEQNGYHAVTQTTLGITLKVRGYEKWKCHGANQYKGLLLKDER